MIKDIEELVFPKCRLCPRQCGVERNLYKGLCKTNNELEVASYNLHFGEEPPISGINGSGTIFFAGCSLSCVYCQNYPISQLKSAYKKVSTDELAEIMIKLQKRGAHNINLVTPSHFVHLICESIDEAKKLGLKIPIVYNTSSYDRDDVVLYLEKYVDIYLADLKYTNSSLSKSLSGVSDYFEIAIKALLAMYKTKGALKVINGIATSGLMVRHLILPGHPDNTIKVIKWIEDNLPDVPISLMSQYFPAYKAFEFKDINRKLKEIEYNEIVSYLNKTQIDGFIQDYCNNS